MSKEATIIQSFNDVKRQYEYFVKGYDVTESVKILLKRHKEEYDKEKKIFASIDGYLEAQKEYQSQISDLEAKLTEKEKENLTLFSMLYETLEKQGCENIASTIEQMTNLTLEKQSNWFKGNCVKEQDKISFAVEQLEKVKETAECVLDNALKNSSLNESYYDRLLDEIDNQIKQLKEMK